MFVSYSRETGAPDARRLCTDLAVHLGAGQVLAASEDHSLDAGDCRVFVALLGPGWQATHDAFASDLERALANHLPVIPVVTRQATVPPREQVPDTIRALLDNHPRLTIEIPSDFYWDVTVSHLARWIRAIADEDHRRAKAADAARERCRRIERDLAKGAERLHEGERSAAVAQDRRATLETAVQSAAATAAARASELDPARVASGLRVYLSYRPSTGGDVRTLERDLRERIAQVRLSGSETISQHAEAAEVIEERIARVDVLLVVIGPDWLATVAGDPARLEIATALQHGIPVIPVLTQHARMPERAALPEGLAALADETPFELLVAFWEDGVAQLVTRLTEIESDLQRRMDAREDAQATYRKLERDLEKARGRQDAADTAIRTAREQLATLERELAQAKDELERGEEERPDQNRAFLDGPGEIGPGTHASRPHRSVALRAVPSRVLAGAVALIVLVVVVVLISH